jgi:hypothetical protein
MTERGATTFLVAAAKKRRSELQAILSDPAKLNAAASYHKIKPEWASFWIREELNRPRSNIR